MSENEKAPGGERGVIKPTVLKVSELTKKEYDFFRDMFGENLGRYVVGTSKQALEVVSK